MAKKKRKLTAWQLHVKSYMAKHPGLSFKEALPKAKLTYRRSSNPARPRASSKPRKVKRKMARRYTRKRRRSSGGMTVPLAVVVPLAVGVVPQIIAVMQDPSEMGVSKALNHLCKIYTGYAAVEGRFEPQMLAHGLFPLLAGLLIHKFVGGAPFNLNRMLARAKVPFVRI